MKRTLPIVLSLLLLWMSTGAKAAEPSVEDLLPANAILAACYYGDNAAVEKTALYQLIQEPEVKEWLTSVRQTVQGANQLAAGFLGVNVGMLTPLLDCRVGLAVLPGVGGPPQALMVAKVGAEGDVRAAVEKFLGGMVPAGAAKGEAGGVVVVPLGPGGACFGFRGDYLFLGTSTRAVELAASPQTPKLSSAASFKDALGMGSSPVGVLAYNHVALMEAFGPMVPRQLTTMLDGLGLRNTDLLVMRLGAKGRALVGTGSVQARGEWKGLMKALVSTPVDKSLLKLAPRDAAIAWASNMSLEDLYAGVLGLINAIDAGGELDIGIEKNMAAFQARVGVDIQKDIFGSLGRGTVVTTSATSALPALIISCTLKDGDRLERGLTKLVAELDAYIKTVNDPPAGAALKTLTFGQHTIRYLATPGVPVPLAPCYVRTQDRLLLAMSPIHMKDYLLFLDKGEPSVLDNPGFQELAALVPDNAMSIGYSNVGESFVEMYGLLGPLLTLAHGIPNNPLAVDFANLPSKRTVRKHMFGSISYTYATRNRLVYECQSPFGVPFIGAAPAGLPAVAVGGVLAGMLLPALARARDEARLIRDRNNLNQIAKGLATYLNEHGDNRFYPRGLGELWDKKVIPDRQVFVSPLDRAPPKLPNGIPCSYESCFDRHPNRIFRDDFPPNFICAWDRVPFLRGRRNVMFFDSHVEALGEMRFQELLRQIDEAAGKLKERPDKRGEF